TVPMGAGPGEKNHDAMGDCRLSVLALDRAVYDDGLACSRPSVPTRPKFASAPTSRCPILARSLYGRWCAHRCSPGKSGRANLHQAAFGVTLLVSKPFNPWPSAG